MLNRHEKHAIFNLSLLAASVLLFLLIWQTMGISKAPAGFVILAFQGIGHLLFLRKKSSSEVVADERDISIRLKAFSGSFYFLSMYYVITALAVYFSHSEGGVVSVDYFLAFVWAGWVVQVFSSSLITLIQYRRGVNRGIC